MPTITISDAEFQAIKGQLCEESQADVSQIKDFVGQKLFIRTVTYHLTGRVTKVVGNLIELEDAAWIASSGRFANAIKSGSLDEVEPVGRAWVNLGSVVDMFPWNHALPQEQK